MSNTCSKYDSYTLDSRYLKLQGNRCLGNITAKERFNGKEYIAS